MKQQLTERAQAQTEWGQCRDCGTPSVTFAKSGRGVNSTTRETAR